MIFVSKLNIVSAESCVDESNLKATINFEVKINAIDSSKVFVNKDFMKNLSF